MNRGEAVAALAVALLLAPLFMLSLDKVPFHPDEMSLLYQSRDLEALYTHPGRLVDFRQWQTEPEVAYRVLNAPLAKYILALGRRASGFGPEAVSVDWDWSQGWQANAAAGAIPPDPALLGARLASALAAWLAAPALWLAGRRLGGTWAGWLAAASYGLNALVLLHGRRAMAEGTLLLTVAFGLLVLLAAAKRPLLAGAAGGLALAAKHSAAPLTVSSWLAAFSASPARSNSQPGDRFRRLALAVASSLLVFYLLSPHLWANPLAGALTTLEARGRLLQEQIELTAELAPDRLLDRPSERLAALVGHLFFLPVQLREIGNYDQALTPAYRTYLNDPRSQLLRGNLAGAVLLGLAILGIVLSGLTWRRLGMDDRRRRGLLLTASVLQAGALLLANPLPIQRYYLPLLPMVCLWAGLGGADLLDGLKRARQPRSAGDHSPAPTLD